MKKFICGSVLLMPFIFWVNNCFGGSMAVSITKEILLTPGEFFIPTSLSTTPDNELIVTASWPGAKTGLATKVSLDGVVRWSYRWKDALAQPPSASVIVGSAVLPNGEVLLCGNETIGSTAKDAHEIRVKGRLSKLNAQGELIEASNLLPPSPFDIDFGGLNQCGRWGDRAYAVGFGFRVFPYAGDATKPHINTSESFLWIVRIDANGKTLWEKVIPTKSNVGPRLPRPQVLPNGDLLVAGDGADNNGAYTKSPDLSSTELVVLSPDGKIRARRNIDGSYVPVRRLSAGLPVMLFPWQSHWYPASPTKTLDLDTSLATIGQREADQFRGVFAYLRGGNQLVKFGFSDVIGVTHRGVASIDLATGKFDEHILPGGGEDTYEINDVTALDQGNQFAFTATRAGSSIPGKHAIGITVLELK